MSAEKLTNSAENRIWYRFKKNRLAVLGLCIIGLFAVLAAGSYWIMPDKSPMANRMSVELRIKPPGFSVLQLLLPKNHKTDEVGFWEFTLYGQPDSYFYKNISDYYFSGDSLITVSYAETGEEGVHTGYRVASICYPTGTVPEGTGIKDMQELVTKQYIQKTTYWLGTDLYGRDMLSRLILGSRVSIAVGFMSVLISILLGVFIGSLAGYYGGKTDAVLSWLINVLWALPSLLIVVALSAVFGKGFLQIFIAIGLTSWVEAARMVRGQMLSFREVSFVEAAGAMGFSDGRIIVRHILPNMMVPILVAASSNFATAILLEAGLSFLGYGVHPPMPSWGGMIKEHYAYIVMHAAYLSLLPGLSIVFLVYAFNIVSIGLSDALNVNSR